MLRMISTFSCDIARAVSRSSVGVSVLLRQAHGCESLGTVRVLLAASGPFPTDEPYLPTLHPHFNSAASAPSVQGGADEHIVARVQELHRPQMKLVPGFHPAPEVAAEAVVSVNGPSLLRREILELLAEERQHPLNARIVQAAKHRLDDLHVLLRHRPVSIPQAQESA